VYQPYVAARALALAGAAITLPVVNGEPDLKAFVAALTDDYRHHMEDQRGSRLIWNDDGSHKPESAAQLVLFGRAEVHCAYNDVGIVWEAGHGRGPVDFFFSTGYRSKAALEVKLMDSSRYWHGLEVQLPNYLKAAGARIGHFVGIAVMDQHLTAPQWVDLPERTRDARRASGFDIASTPVNGVPLPSASRS
jgi:hypothetical protein